MGKTKGQKVAEPFTALRLLFPVTCPGCGCEVCWILRDNKTGWEYCRACWLNATYVANQKAQYRWLVDHPHIPDGEE